MQHWNRSWSFATVIKEWIRRDGGVWFVGAFQRFVDGGCVKGESEINDECRRRLVPRFIGTAPRRRARDPNQGPIEGDGRRDVALIRRHKCHVIATLNCHSSPVLYLSSFRLTYSIVINLSNYGYGCVRRTQKGLIASLNLDASDVNFWDVVNDLRLSLRHF